ncbi:dystrophin-like isoform X1 [Neodiprion virginianus]|uniref:dystrophin-like isoform X1 n=2 Tax=Neodiprion virginianus TaxID=2961670 RepID=UPI001EE71436|nr:dystrophin-like isoform X1 [Neodiprion virginianus]
MTEEYLNGWKQAETEGGVPYYINHATKQTEWDHPRMREIMRSVEECNVIRYASYRTAAKMRILHRDLNMQQVRLELIAGVFERHRLSVTENSVTLDPTELEDVLSDIYFAAQKEANTNFNTDLATKLGVNYILNIFDKKREGSVSVFSAKVALTLASCSRLQDKYGYLYQQLADHNACLSRAALSSLLSNICKVTDMLGESVAYGSHMVQLGVDNCFVESQGSLGVSEAEFAAWLMQEPPLLMWITTLNRMQAAENIIHNVKCSSCKTTPIQGPRYSCLRCAGYHQCQGCFLLGKATSKHKLKHPVREYCVKTSNREVTKLIIELIRNKLRLCPSRTVIADPDEPPPEMQHLTNDEKDGDNVSLRSTVRRKVLNNPQRELQSIISHLEDENRQLQAELLEICGTRAERLQRHRATIESQLQRLKILKKYLFNQPVQPRIMTHMESTPMLHPIASRVTPLPLEFELSPIVQQGTVERKFKRDSTFARQGREALAVENFDSSPVTSMNSRRDKLGTQSCTDSNYPSSGFGGNLSEFTPVNLSTWIGGGKGANGTGLAPSGSGFSQWLRSGNSVEMERGGDKQVKPVATSSSHGDSPPAVSHSPIGLPRENNTPSSLQRPDKHSQHSSLQNIQGDLNDILDRLQNMVANDSLLEGSRARVAGSFSANDNCELKRAATEMEDLLTGLIEGMESRKGKLATIV